MKRKSNKKDWRYMVGIGMSLLMAGSMLCGTVMMLRPADRPAPPTPEVTQPAATPAPPEITQPTVAPTPTGPAQPTATPAPTSTVTADVAAGKDSFTFAVCGDTRNGDAVYASILQQVMNDGARFLIHTGDIVPTGLEFEWKSWQKIQQALTIPFYPVPGNHDALLGNMGPYLKYSGAPAAHYSFDIGRAHFSFVDSHSGYLTADETAWLDADLARTAQPLKIVVLHYPPFDPNGGEHVMTRGAEEFMSLMQARGVRYVFAGHLHAYEAAERDGVQYVITGGGGAPLSAPEDQGGYYHYLLVHVRGEELSYEVVRVPQPGAQIVPLRAAA